MRRGGISTQLLIAIIVPVGVSVLLFIVGFCRRSKKKYDAIEEDTIGNDTTTAESLQYNLGTVQAATNNFSTENKIGEGGFGLVYKGTLSNGQEVAAKRLSRTSGQGAEEFKNEVVLVAKLQHRNLVRLLGYCLEGEEKILIHEFLPNKSLDYLLFDPKQEEKLDWVKRYKIIGGIAKGMLYLHEDFGMVRIFGVDQIQGNTSRVVGTYYMSSEYVMHEQFSVKSDVFSFGVLVLEIISGKKNNTFYELGCAEDLLNYSWKLWAEE
ncbi:unnamed protein product [Camellia sinensis]